VINWLPLIEVSELHKISADSSSKPIVLFKHSTRCSISSMAKSRLDREATPENVDFYLLDLIANRIVSDAITAQFSVHHESPQLLLIYNQTCVYDASHIEISMAELITQIDSL
jgi:bacillithiol system protein YtxJ